MLDLDAVAHVAPAIAQKRDERECVECGDTFPNHGHRVRCIPCAKLRKRELDAERVVAWRSEMRERDPEGYAAYLRKMRECHQRRRRNHGALPKAVRDEVNRKRSAEIIPKIEALRRDGLSCAQIGERLGMSKNTVIGLIDRHRKRNASRVCAIAEAPVARRVDSKSATEATHEHP